MIVGQLMFMSSPSYKYRSPEYMNSVVSSFSKLLHSVSQWRVHSFIMFFVFMTLTLCYHNLESVMCIFNAAGTILLRTFLEAWICFSCNLSCLSLFLSVSTLFSNFCHFVSRRWMVFRNTLTVRLWIMETK